MNFSSLKAASLYVLTALLLLTKSACSQTDISNAAIQDSLSKFSSVIWKQKSDSGRLAANEFFFTKFKTALEAKSSISLALDSIKGITLTASDDKKIRIFTWNIPLSDGSNKYFGFIQFISDSSIIIPLKSNETVLGDFSQAQVTPKLWYGAIYYKIIPVQIGTKQAYTLLGWDGHTQTSNRKIIDMLAPDGKGDFVFGLPVFKTKAGIKSRVVIEYAEKANMLLRYDYQTINIQKRKKIVKVDAWLIVMDRLIPMQPAMEGMRKYYVPAGDTYDGYIFKNGYWVLAEDIEVANKLNGKK